MRLLRHLCYAAVLSLCLASIATADTNAQGKTGVIPKVIELFISQHFPTAQSHFWVLNKAEWAAPEEVVLDLNAVVVTQENLPPTEQRFLLLVVSGQIIGMQSIPLGARVECKPDEVV